MNCSETENLITNISFIIVICSQAIAGFFSGIVSVIATVKCGGLHFHINCRILIITMLLLYIAHSFLITALQAGTCEVVHIGPFFAETLIQLFNIFFLDFHSTWCIAIHLRRLITQRTSYFTTQVIRYRTYSDPCYVGLPVSACFGLRFPATVCMTSFALLQLAMVAERSVALWKRSHYETYGPTLGVILAAISVVAALMATAWAMWRQDFSQSQVYCSAATVHTAERLTLLCFGICGMNLITLIGIATLFTFNAFAIKRKHFDLKTSYQLRENYSVIRLILPLTLFQAICYAIFSGSSGIISMFRDSFTAVGYRTIFASTYIIPFYTLISPVLMWLAIRYSRQLKTAKLKSLTRRRGSARDAYFKTYLHMWNNNAVIK